MKFVLHLGILIFLQNCCYCYILDIEGDNNNFPRISNVVPEPIEMNVGSNISLFCSKKNSHHDNHVNNGITWERMPCEFNSYMGVECDTEKAHDVSKGLWESIPEYKGREQLKIKDSRENNSGIYRCKNNMNVKKIWILEITSPGSWPIVVSLDVANITSFKTIHYTLRCNVSSKPPPKIYWFKKCGQKYDLREDGVNYCHISSGITSYNFSTMFLSKLKFFDAKYTDTGTYACGAVNEYGKHYKTIVINVPNYNEEEKISLFLLFLIPFVLFIPMLLSWLCYYGRKHKKEQMKYMGSSKIVAQNSRSKQTNNRKNLQEI